MLPGERCLGIEEEQIEGLGDGVAPLQEASVGGDTTEHHIEFDDLGIGEPELVGIRIALAPCEGGGPEMNLAVEPMVEPARVVHHLIEHP